MGFYRIYDHIQDKYVIQNMKTLDVKLVSKEEIDIIKQDNDIKYCDLKSELTRKILAGLEKDEIVFQARYYRFVYCQSANYNYFMIDMYFFSNDIPDEIPVYLCLPNMRYKFNHGVDYNYSNNNQTIQVVGKTKTMEGLFRDCNVVNVDLTYLDTSEVTSMEDTFKHCTNLRELNLQNLNLSKVQTMRDMCCGCHALTEVNLDNDLTSLDVMSLAFAKCDHLREVKLTIRSKEELGVDLSSLFYDDKNLQNVELDIQKPVISMAFTFEDCLRLHNVNFINIDTRYCISLKYMFTNCVELKTLDLSKLVIDTAVDTKGLFDACINLYTLDISNFAAIDINSSFNNCQDLTKLYYDEDLVFTGINKKLPNIFLIKRTGKKVEKYKEKDRDNYIRCLEYYAVNSIFENSMENYKNIRNKQLIKKDGTKISRVDFAIHCCRTYKQEYSGLWIRCSE